MLEAFYTSLISTLLWVLSPGNFGIEEIDYLIAILIAITLWLVVVPLAAGRISMK